MKTFKYIRTFNQSFFQNILVFYSKCVEEHFQQIWDDFVYFCQKAPTFSMPRQNFAIFQNWQKLQICLMNDQLCGCFEDKN